MKRIIAIIAVFATLLSFAACKVNMTEEERQAKKQAELSEKQAASIKAEEDFSKGFAQEVDKLGKTIKGERLVVKEPTYGIGEYLVFEFDRKENLKKRYSYKFFYDINLYEAAVENGDGTRRKLVEKDEKARMVIYEIEIGESDKVSFDFLYETYSDEASVEAGYEVIE